MNPTWWKSPSLWDRWVLGASLASVSESAGHGPLWEPAPQCRGLPGSRPMVTASRKAPGKGSFHLLKPHPPTGCCKNHPDSPSRYGTDDQVSERSLAGFWHLLHFSYVTHVGARKHKGTCVLWIQSTWVQILAPWFTSCVSLGKLHNILVSQFPPATEKK